MDTTEDSNTEKVRDEDIRCHKGEPFVGIAHDGKVLWTVRRHGKYPDPYDHCSYCGSIHFDDVKQVIAEGGKLGGSDWKYGYPHKFYVYPKNGGQYKFYTQHLEDLEDETKFAEFAELLKTYTGIEFVRDEKGVKYAAPYHGYQR